MSKNIKNMKAKIVLVAALISTFLMGCKNEKSVDSLEVVKPEIVDTSFKVTVDVIVKSDDDFSLFYTQDGTTNFTGEPIWLGVKGSQNEQQVVFELPDDVFPSQLRLDFGLKQNLDEVVLKKISYSYKGKTFDMIGNQIGMYFHPDLNKCTYDPNTGIIKPILKDGVAQFPSLYPHDVANTKALEELAK